MFATRSIFVAIVAVAGIGAAHAEPKPPVSSPAAASAETTAPAARTDEPRYCFKEALTDSRVVRKICKTKSQWADMGVTLPAKY